MIRITGLRARFVVFALVVFALCSLILVGPYKVTPAHLTSTSTSTEKTLGRTSAAVLKGHAIAPKLENATAKAELGRAAWKVLHTTFARFPESPTEEEQEALRSYVHLFQRLYPCGECAEHFGQVLAKYPPQVSSRTAAAMWGCYVHNIVNKRLKKPEFNCADIGDAYDCGCGDDEPTASSKGTAA
jgi:hypothetical protein